MSLRKSALILDVIEEALAEVPPTDPAMRERQTASIAAHRLSDATVAVIREPLDLASAPLPADLADVDPATRESLDAVARRFRITAAAALSLARSGQRARATVALHGTVASRAE
ncbi:MULTISPECIES: hypothetical protein [unclassified Leifsonia]|uniref:hypothetical protein n=1 Tax=unclassified Leifsonia TaxID=2663824 RepID=UPI0006F7D712|nr:MULTISPECIES: hypothetical protein [unclassified Leifsonia]KQX07193.1 hypothetical protein ASC59_05195 [Leifsonia sp. Root1293]KRA11476.1 hypothetical protein ASD61_05195 [Leifsonia sp. Root60]